MALALKPPRIGWPAAVLGGVLIALVGAFVAIRLWDRSVEARLGRWAASEVEQRTGGAYRLTVGDVTFLPFDGSLAFVDAVRDAVHAGVRAGTTELWPLTQAVDAAVGPFPAFAHELAASVRAHLALT